MPRWIIRPAAPRHRWLLCIVLALLTPAHAAEISTRPLLRVGMSVTPTSTVTQEAGVVRGFAVDCAQALSTALGRELELVVLPERQQIAALKGGRVDVLLSTQPVADLHALRLAASQPVLRLGHIALLRREQLARYNRPFDVLITDERVGFVQGTDAARVVHEWLPRAERVPLATVAAAIAAVRSGQLALVVVDAFTGWRITADPNETQLVGVMEPLTEEQLMWVVRETEGELLQQIDAVLQRWSREGTVAQLLGRWLAARVEM